MVDGFPIYNDGEGLDGSDDEGKPTNKIRVILRTQLVLPERRSRKRLEFSNAENERYSHKPLKNRSDTRV